MSRRLPGSLLFADIGAKVLAAVFGVSVLFFGAVKVYEVDSWAKFFAAIFFYCASASGAAAMVDGTVKRWFTGMSSLGLAWVRTPFHR